MVAQPPMMLFCAESAAEPLAVETPLMGRNEGTRAGLFADDAGVEPTPGSIHIADGREVDLAAARRRALRMPIVGSPAAEPTWGWLRWIVARGINGSSRPSTRGQTAAGG